MSISSADQRELFLPLVEGVLENPPWGVFMRNLVARTRARRALLILTLADAMAAQEPTVLQAAAPHATPEPPFDFHRLKALGLYPYEALRPDRIYGIDEMLDYDDRAQLAFQRDSLEAMGIHFGRWLRITARGVADAWLLLVRENEDFISSAVATLSAIGPHLAASLRIFSALTEQRVQTALAQSALRRIGVAQLAFDAEGCVLAADPDAEQVLSFAHRPEGEAKRRLVVLPEVSAALDAACATLASGPHGASQIVPIDPRTGLDLLLRKSDLALAQPCTLPAVLGTLRQARREEAKAGAGALQALYGLSSREAALAEALSRGKSIIEAGRELKLTDETARNYSKRIYAKVGARGQGDLVRLVLTGLAPFA